MEKISLAQSKLVNLIVALVNRILEIFKIDFQLKIDSPYHKIIPHDINRKREFRKIYEKCKDYTMTSVVRMFSLYNAIEYIVKNNIEGDIVECGVWKGGSMMLSALSLLKMNDTTRKIYLYDTYEGMPEPTEHDIRTRDKRPAINKYETLKKHKKKWSYASFNEVKRNLYSTKYPKENLIFIKGKVEDTIPNIEIPDKISILRLDTDWYESTYHEFKHLYPRLSIKGILILDDYDLWKGSKEATDKYFKENNINLLLNRIGKGGRLAIKLE